MTDPGLWALFGSAFVSSTLLPGGSEAVLLVLALDPSAIFSRALAQLWAGVVVGIVGLVVLRFEDGTEAPGVLLAVPALMIVVGLFACVVPARRALRIQPTEALREGG